MLVADRVTDLGKLALECQRISKILGDFVCLVCELNQILAI